MRKRLEDGLVMRERLGDDLVMSSEKGKREKPNTHLLVGILGRHSELVHINHQVSEAVEAKGADREVRPLVILKHNGT